MCLYIYICLYVCDYVYIARWGQLLAAAMRYKPHSAIHELRAAHSYRQRYTYVSIYICIYTEFGFRFISVRVCVRASYVCNKIVWIMDYK